MKKIHLYFMFLIVIFSYGFVCKTTDPIKEYLNVKGPIDFNKTIYNLSWSSHPTSQLYKQEYIPAGEISDKFNSMVMIDLTVGNFSIKDVLEAKITELKKLKKTNPIVNYQVIQNNKKDEYILDFLVSDNSADGKSINIVERNVYRYKVYSDIKKRKGVLMFGISKRSYGDDITNFFKDLKINMNDLVNTVGQYQVPDVEIANN